MLKISGWIALIFLTSIAGAIYFNVTYKYEDLKTCSDTLLNVSSAVFTLMGIWIAFIYPNALSRIVDPKRVAAADFSENSDEYKRLSNIVGSVMKSAGVVLAIMAFNLLRVVLPNFSIITDNLVLVKQIALGSMISLFALQAHAVWEVITANILFLNDLYTKKATKDIEKEY